LLDAAERGSEPTRAAFKGAIIAYSSIPHLEDILARIVVYPEHEREDKLKAFYSQVWTLRWFLSEAERRADRYLLLWSASELALFSARLILAHNRILCPSHKWLMWEVEHAPDKPADLVQKIDALLADPSDATATSLWESLAAFHDWGVPDHEAIPRFALLNEWNWRNGPAPLADW
jgi:hypothetical protein